MRPRCDFVWNGLVFPNVNAPDYLESAIPVIEEVEREGRLQGALCMEGRKNGQ